MSCIDLLRFGRHSSPIPQRIEGWVGLETEVSNQTCEINDYTSVNVTQFLFAAECRPSMASTVCCWAPATATIVAWPTTSCFADWSKCRHVMLSIIECWTCWRSAVIIMSPRDWLERTSLKWPSILRWVGRKICLQWFDAVDWATGRASGL